MSLFHTETIACPACEAKAEYQIADSVAAARRPSKAAAATITLQPKTWVASLGDSSARIGSLKGHDNLHSARSCNAFRRA